MGVALTMHLNTNGVKFPLTVDPLLHTQLGILHASNAGADDAFGYSIAISGDTMVVGATGEDTSYSNAGAQKPGKPTCHFDCHSAGWPGKSGKKYLRIPSAA